jgi:hypothetical protein
VVRVASLRAGTGSAHTGAVLRTDDGDQLTLVQLRGNPFEDPSTQSLDGQRVEVEGYRLGRELRFISLRVIP